MKIEFYCYKVDIMCNSFVDDKYIFVLGMLGMVMLVFIILGLDYVYKVIKDKFSVLKMVIK